MSGLRLQQIEFTRRIGKLIGWAYENGYALTFGDAYRDPKVFGEVGEFKGYGHPKSNHKSKLAVDFNLFKEVNGEWVYQTSSHAHKDMGLYWESLGEECSWGGWFNDGNHYSFRYKGRR